MDDHDHDERCTPEAARERAAWTRDIAAMLREQTKVAPELRAGYLDAANWLDPAPGGGEPPRLPMRKDPAQRALMVRLEGQKTAIIAAREIMRMVLPDHEAGGEPLTAIGRAVTRWLDQFGALADPPAVVEVEEDDDEGDDVPHDSPEAGRSSGRWQPLGGAAHLDFAEDAARRAREADDA